MIVSNKEIKEQYQIYFLIIETELYIDFPFFYMNFERLQKPFFFTRFSSRVRFHECVRKYMSCEANYLSISKLLAERTYTAPQKWMRGKGRVTIQFGCCYNYAVVCHCPCGFFCIFFSVKLFVDHPIIYSGFMNIIT